MTWAGTTRLNRGSSGVLVFSERRSSAGLVEACGELAGVFVGETKRGPRFRFSSAEVSFPCDRSVGDLITRADPFELFCLGLSTCTCKIIIHFRIKALPYVARVILPCLGVDRSRLAFCGELLPLSKPLFPDFELRHFKIAE